MPAVFCGWLFALEEVYSESGDKRINYGQLVRWDRRLSSGGGAEWHPSGNLDLAAGQEGGFDVSWPIKRADGCELSDETLGAGTYVATASIGQSSARFVMQLQS